MIISAAFTTVSKVVDALWSKVSLLVKDIGINGASNNSFYDDGPYKFLPTRNGDVTQGSFSPFSGTVGDADPLASYGSVYFNGTNWFTTSANSSLALGTGNFTVEFWYYLSANLTSGNMYLLTTETSATNGNSGGLQIMLQGGNNRILAGSWTGTSILANGVGLTGGVWNHLALVRSSGTMTLYVNGVSAGTASNTADLSNSQFCFGAYGETYGTSIGSLFKGYISNVRIVKGTAVYTGNFTVPTAPLTAVSDTVLLTATKSTGAVPVDESSGNVPMKNYGAGPHWMTPFKTGYGSVYFDGSGDYLSLPSSTAVAYGTGDFTVEFWAYPTSNAGSLFVSGYNGTAVAGVNVGITNSTSLWWLFGNGSAWDFERRPTYTLSMNTWHHFAVTRESGTAKLYVDGTLVDSVANSTNFGSSAWYVGASAAAGYNMTGYVSNLRAVKGSAVYTGSSFAVPTAPLTAISGTSLLTCQDKGSIVDASTNSFTVSRVGDARPSRETPFAQKAAGYWSTAIGTSSSYLSLPANDAAFSFGTGDFTIEGWFYRNDASSLRTLFNIGNYAANRCILFRSDYFQFGSATANLNSYLPAGQWLHVAVTRQSGNYWVFVNGVIVNSGTNTTNISATAGSETMVTVGTSIHAPSSENLNGYVSNFRVVKGTALYTAAFTPPTTPLTTVAGTTLLTCQDNRFRDVSSSGLTVTPNSVSVSRLNPFGQTMTAPTVNVASTGSVYFDGNGDCLTLTDNAAFAFGTGDFCVEMFIAPSTSGTLMLYDGRPTSTNGTQPILFLSNSQLVFQWSPAQNIASTATVPLGKWSHVALTRSGSTVRIFLDGVQVATTTNTTSLTNGTNRPMIGGDGASNSGNYSGYISNVRVVKGSAVYTADFTPSTSPLAAISGTSLLTAQDAVTVTDASSNNFTVTKVGDAKAVDASPFKRVSTVLAGSAYFDGTGDWLTVKDNPALRFGTGDFTIEYWMNGATSPSGNVFIMDKGENGTGSFRIQANSGQTTMLIGGTALVYVNPAPYVGSWYHVAFVRSGTTLTAYLNGVKASTATNSTDMSSTADLTVGGTASGTTPMNGYLANVRLVKGAAVYSANFTPPVAPVDAVGGTSLLLNFDNAGIYDASGNSDLGIVGTVKSSASISKYGGSSLAFDGSASYAYPVNTSDYAFGTGDFTIEAWIRVNSFGSLNFLYDGRPGSSGVQPTIYFDSGGVYYYANAGNRIAISQTLSTDTWYHVAVSRSSGTTRMFLNGVQGGVSYSDTNSYVSATAKYPRIGLDSVPGGSYPLNGYIDDFRVTKGAARYTANFTPPTLEAATRKA